MRCEWDRAKAASNLRKHGVSFEEAATALVDEFAVTAADPDHSVGESRVHFIEMVAMKKPKAVAAEDLRAEYRREDLGPLTRGKYAGRVKIDPKVVILRPEVARAFPTSEAVNDALMRLIDLARAAAPPVKRTTGRAKPR